MANKKKKKEPKKQLGELEESLVNDVEAYVKEVNKHRPKGNKISKIELIRNYFTELLADKVLTNDFISLGSSYYYNLEDLRSNSEVIASTEVFSEPEHQVKIEQIPNNLDSWSIEENTYCYNGNPKEHKGINITVLYYPAEEDLLEVNYIVYKLTESELKVGLVKPEFLAILLDKPEEHELLKELKSIEAEIKEDIEKGLPKNQITVKYNSRSNFKMLFHETGVNNIAKHLGRLYIKWLQLEAKYNSDSAKVIKEAKAIGIERMPDKVLDEYNNKLDSIYNEYIANRTKLINSITGAEETPSKEEVKANFLGFIEENPSLEPLKELFLIDEEEDVDLTTKAKTFEKQSKDYIESVSDTNFNPLEVFLSLLDNSEDSNNIRTLIGLASKYTVEDYEENPEVVLDFVKEIEDSFNIDFGFNPEEEL